MGRGARVASRDGRGLERMGVDRSGAPHYSQIHDTCTIKLVPVRGIQARGFLGHSYSARQRF